MKSKTIYSINAELTPAQVSSRKMYDVFVESNEKLIRVGGIIWLPNPKHWKLHITRLGYGFTIEDLKFLTQTVKKLNQKGRP